MKVEVLCTTMHQKDFSKYKEMNLQTDAIIANQADFNNFEEKEINGKKIKLITTDTRGLSKNRNIALKNVADDTDYIIFTDDDLIFYNGYEKIVTDEFNTHPEADAIKFNLNCISERKISMKPTIDFMRATRRNITSSGVCGLAVNLKKLLNSGIVFDERFGAGTENFCGEDSIFLQDLFKRKLNVYLSPQYIADIDQKNSTWNVGHNEKYFTVGGMVINECYPLLSYGLVIRSAIKARKRKSSKLGFFTILKCYYKGIFKNLKEKRN